MKTSDLDIGDSSVGRLVRRSKTVLYRSSKHNFVMHLTMNENDCSEFPSKSDLHHINKLYRQVLHKR